MKLSALTITALENFAKFNSHLVVVPGNTLRTVNEKKTQLIKCEIEDEFPVEFALHDLPGFLKTLKLFNEPEIEFGENSMIITDNSGAMQEYYYSDKDDLIYDERDVKFPSADIEFVLPDEKLKAIKTAAATLGVEDIAICGENGKVVLKALNKENPKRVHSIVVVEEDLGEFTAYMKHSKKGARIDYLPLDYYVQINKAKIIQFTAKVEDIEYSVFQALERDSEL